MPKVATLYRTSDMAEVTFLRLLGYTHQEVYWDGGSCYWNFLQTDSLVKAVDKFHSDEATVNPKEYNREFTRTKREFYDSRL